MTKENVAMEMEVCICRNVVFELMTFCSDAFDMSRLSAWSVKQRTAAVNLFNRFLYLQKLPEFDQLKEEQINADLFALFASHMYRYEDRIKHSSTALSYAVEKFKKNLFRGEENVMSRIRKNLGRQFDQRLEKSGIPSVGHAEGVTEDAIEFSVECLFNPSIGKFVVMQRRAAERLMLCLDRSLCLECPRLEEYHFPR
jgi:hypothetical protein